MNSLLIQREVQLSPVSDPYSALFSLIRPILYGLLYSLKGETVDDYGGHENIKLRSLPRARRAGDGDVGICFEYAVHEAIRNRDPMITDRVQDALTRHCRVPGYDIESILFGAEKTGSIQLIDTAHNVLTEDSRILTGIQSQPPKLKAHLNKIAEAFRRRDARNDLPSSINGLWKADLFLGYTDTDRWVGTTVKINPRALEGAQGLRVGIVPANYGGSDLIHYDDRRNLVVCPLPYDGSFMELFYNAWQIVMQLIHADMYLPKEVNLPHPLDRQVASQLVNRREHSVIEVISALTPLAQPHLLRKTETGADLQQEDATDEIKTESLISPIPQYIE